MRLKRTETRRSQNRRSAPSDPHRTSGSRRQSTKATRYLNNEYWSPASRSHGSLVRANAKTQYQRGGTTRQRKSPFIVLKRLRRNEPLLSPPSLPLPPPTTLLWTRSFCPPGYHRPSAAGWLPHGKHAAISSYKHRQRTAQSQGMGGERAASKNRTRTGARQSHQSPDGKVSPRHLLWHLFTITLMYFDRRRVSDAVNIIRWQSHCPHCHYLVTQTLGYSNLQILFHSIPNYMCFLVEWQYVTGSGRMHLYGIF